MILTEEQRAALKRVVAYMDEMYAIDSPYYGCTEDANILRAMIDGSGTVEPAGGFDLEKARAADEVLPYPLDAKEIWVSGKGQMHINLPNAPSIFFTLSDLCEFRNIFHVQAAEIERLRGEMENYGDDYVCQMKSKDARIQELEDAHKRSGLKYAKIINELRSSVYANIPGLKKQWDEILNTPANGKIGPGSVAPPCWHVTDERKAVILHCKRMLTFLKEDDAPCYDVEKITKDESVLVAMLEEADHDKP